MACGGQLWHRYRQGHETGTGTGRSRRGRGAWRGAVPFGLAISSVRVTRCTCHQATGVQATGAQAAGVDALQCGSMHAQVVSGQKGTPCNS